MGRSTYLIITVLFCMSYICMAKLRSENDLDDDENVFPSKASNDMHYQGPQENVDSQSPSNGNPMEMFMMAGKFLGKIMEYINRLQDYIVELLGGAIPSMIGLKVDKQLVKNTMTNAR